MKHFASLLSIALCAVLSYGQMETLDSPLKVTMCQLYEHPEQYVGKMVEVRVNVSGNDLALDDFSNQKSCSAYMKLHLELPQKATPAPGFSLVHGDAYNELLGNLHRGMNVIATFEGRFDPLFVWRDQKRVRIGEGADKGYGKNHRYDGRIVLRKVSDVQARSVPRR
ncbi:MAG: hypothetical protein JST79_19590 [Acidobacteria bacterium]|nr:hypothetical protein [Acidobacteriota bacterium]